MTGGALDVAIELPITSAVVDEKQRTVRALLRLHDTCFRLATSNDPLIRELTISASPPSRARCNSRAYLDEAPPSARAA